ncbi:MAG: ABC transporter permease [Clostridiales bacterium]|nr:ABC transporter permease [Clostridiales bacterium]MCD7828290.1 ABC transporter permease [Clostridiales bacterium]
MTKRLQSITGKASPVITLCIFVAVWAAVCGFGSIPSYMLPSPGAVISSFISDFPTLMSHSAATLTEAALGLGIGIILAFITASLMDRFKILYNSFYPLLVISQTIPTVAIAPILILWMGFGMAPKIALVVLTTFFPITIGLLDGYRSADPDAVSLLRSMGAGRLQIFRYIKLPSALPHFFSGLKISASYAIVGAVIAEWLGGFEGLGVYMTRVRKAYSFDKMFAVIILIIILSLILMCIVSLIRRLVMPWERVKGENKA